MKTGRMYSTLLHTTGMFLIIPLMAAVVTGTTACSEFQDEHGTQGVDSDTGINIKDPLSQRDVYDAAEPSNQTESDSGSEEPGIDILAQDIAHGADTNENPDITGQPDLMEPDEEIDEGPSCPGAPGCPCQEPDECFSGFCVPTENGSECTKMCSSSSECDDDMLCSIFRGTSGPDSIYVCLSRWPTACRPCTEDRDCAVAWLDEDIQPLCVSGNSGDKYCVPVLDDTDDFCPDGFENGTIEINEEILPVCLPEGGVCPCRDEWVRSGYETECEISNEWGVCKGRHLCNEECPARIPAKEVCDGVDNNCDGQIDEGLQGGECLLINKNGTCTGVMSCVHGRSECNGTAAIPEQCNGLDDDCDGFTDEGLGVKSCGTGICQHTVDNCSGGQVQFCNPLEGMAAETCNGLDDDCDGRTDEDLGYITCGRGVCAKTVKKCIGGMINLCIPYPAQTYEICDNRDNDCDGLVDEGFGKITCGVGRCKHTVYECINGQPDYCEPLEGATGEKCNGLDDDCDGITDNAIWAPANFHERNDICSKAHDMGVVTEGEPTTAFQSWIYMAKDTDWFSFVADEHNHSCVWGTDQDYRVYVSLFNPTGPESCMPMAIELYDEACNMVAAGIGSDCTKQDLNFTWDGECGPDDSRVFKMRVRMINDDDYSCVPYTLNVTMRKVG